MLNIRIKRSEESIQDLFKVFGNIESYEEISRPVTIRQIPQNEEEMEMLSSASRKIWEKIEEQEEQEDYCFENVF